LCLAFERPRGEPHHEKCHNPVDCSVHFWRQAFAFVEVMAFDGLNDEARWQPAQDAREADGGGHSE
jgi:hypothetical protein